MARGWLLSEDEKREIMRLYRIGVPARLIAPRYGVTASAIWNLASKRKLKRDWWLALERWNRENKWWHGQAEQAQSRRTRFPAGAHRTTAT